MTDSGYSSQALPVGAMIQEFRIIRILGSGAFGLVYQCENTFLPETVAIKEFLPTELAARSVDGLIRPLSVATEANFQWARDKFLQEAKTLWNLGQPVPHRNIVRVTRFSEANGTAYMFMTFEEGRSLADVLEERGTLPYEELRQIVFPLLDGLGRVHSENVLHRDIKPGNILIRSDGSPVLIDFGAARQSFANAERSIIATYTPNYGALEQIHDVGDQGPWTDIYALGATLYRAATGTRPPNVTERAFGNAEMSAANAGHKSYPPAFLAAIDAACALDPKNRPQSVAQWRRMLIDGPGPSSGAPTLTDEASSAKTQIVSEARPTDSPPLDKTEVVAPPDASTPQDKTEVVERSPAAPPLEGTEAIDRSASVGPRGATHVAPRTGASRGLAWVTGAAVTIAIVSAGLWYWTRAQGPLPHLPAGQGTALREPEQAGPRTDAPVDVDAPGINLEQDSGDGRAEFRADPAQRGIAVAVGEDPASALEVSPVPPTSLPPRSAPDGSRPGTDAQDAGATPGTGGNAATSARTMPTAASSAPEQTTEVRGELVVAIAEPAADPRAATAPAESLAKTPPPPPIRQEPVTPGERFRDTLADGKAGPTMVWLPRGSFQMGSPRGEAGRNRDELRHLAEIPEMIAFSQTEVTVKQFSDFVDATGYRSQAERETSCFRKDDSGEKTVADMSLSWLSPNFESSNHHPVTCVSWNDARAYTEWLSAQAGHRYRLPTEVEWEYAARAGSTASRFWGDDANRGCEYANTADSTVLHQAGMSSRIGGSRSGCRDDFVFAAPVGVVRPNDFGLRDMLGNLSEWTCSAYDERYSGREARCMEEIGTAYSAPRVIRGGSWVDPPSFVRSAARDGFPPHLGLNTIGFRVVRKLAEDETPVTRQAEAGLGR